jgi:hypothetical protein
VQWATSPEQFGWDRITSNVLQPLRLNNAIADDSTISYKSATGFPVVVVLDRPALIFNRGSHYDPMLGTYLQPTATWPQETYAGAHSPTKDFDTLDTPSKISVASCSMQGMSETSGCRDCYVPPATTVLELANTGGGGGGVSGCFSCDTECLTLGSWSLCLPMCTQVGILGGSSHLGFRKCVTLTTLFLGCMVWDLGFCGGEPFDPLDTQIF